MIGHLVCMLTTGRTSDASGIFTSTRRSSAHIGTRRTISLIITRGVRMEDSASGRMAGRSSSSILITTRLRSASMDRAAPRRTVLSFTSERRKEM